MREILRRYFNGGYIVRTEEGWFSEVNGVLCKHRKLTTAEHCLRERLKYGDALVVRQGHRLLSNDILAKEAESNRRRK